MEVLSALTTLQCKLLIHKRSKKCYPLKLSNTHPGITSIMKDKTIFSAALLALETHEHYKYLKLE